MKNNCMYVIIDAKDVEDVNLAEVMQTSPDSMRYCVDGSKALVKYEGEQPLSIFGIAGNSIGLPELTHEEVLQILRTPEWVSEIEKSELTS